ncbi:MAG: hypothetical protein MUD01_20820, partial [Chloroflexaceae bacterium]|nr:hypothetical protein [Chloroflexaceae bacterium]
MRRRIPILATLALVALIVATPVLAAPAIGTAAFQRLWNRYDLPVAEQVSGRSWTWGPAPISDLLRETLVDSAEGTRAVQYFDKSRMEVNDPTADPNQLWYVTNGLLPIELMTGRLQIGLNQFAWRTQARISAVGDPNQFPTYADLLRFYQNPGAVTPTDLGRPATGMINPDGSISAFTDYANDMETILVRGENNHGVAKAFVDFMNQQGLVYENGRFVRSQVYDPIFVFGLPVSGAYWVKVKVAGVERPILFQVFERRVLT